MRTAPLLRRWLAGGTLVGALAGCRRDSAPKGSDLAKPGPPDAGTIAPPRVAQQAPSGAAGTRAFPPPKAGERVRIAAARFLAGSQSGDEGRDPRSEAPGFFVDLGGYEIDRLPYPNDPAQAQQSDVTQRDATRLCSSRGERLCTELEWEYACKGAQGDAYATGDGWSGACERQPGGCASGFGVLGLGAEREWTSSEFLTLDKADKGAITVRGASPGKEAIEHRCARRASAAASSHARDLGFRCCAGPASAAAVPAAKLGPTARKVALEPSQVAEIFAAVPQLASLQTPIKYFGEPDDTTAVLKKGRTAQGLPDPEGFTLTVGPLLWNPAPGEEVVVVLGHGTKDSFIVALYRWPDNRYKLASSLVLANDLGPFALAFHPEVRERLLWSSCWKCSGEGGAVVFRDGRRIVIVQQ